MKCHFDVEPEIQCSLVSGNVGSYVWSRNQGGTPTELTGPIDDHSVGSPKELGMCNLTLHSMSVIFYRVFVHP